MTDASLTVERIRLDKWLWAARFFKTRSLAAKIVDGGRVDVNGEPARRARLIRVGDFVTVKRPPFEWHVEVRALAELRGPAREAAKLYEETKESVATRERIAQQQKTELLWAPEVGKGRPTKKDRRSLDRLKRGF